MYLLPMIAWMLISMGFPPGYRWAARHALLPDMERGFSLMKHGDYAGAVDAFERQYDSLLTNRVIDTWRLLFLFEPSAFPFREWILLYMVTPCVQLGQADRVVSLYEECLKLNPDNVYAKSGLALVRSIQTAAAQGAAQSASA